MISDGVARHGDKFRRFRFWDEGMIEDLVVQIVGAPLGSEIAVTTRASSGRGGQVRVGIPLVGGQARIGSDSEEEESVKRILTRQLALELLMDGFGADLATTPESLSQVEVGELVFVNSFWRRTKWDKMRSISVSGEQFVRASEVIGKDSEGFEAWRLVRDLVEGRIDKDITLVTETGSKPGVRWMTVVPGTGVRVQNEDLLDGKYVVAGIVANVHRNPVQLPAWINLKGLVKGRRPIDDQYWFDSLPGPVVELEQLVGFQEVTSPDAGV